MAPARTQQLVVIPFSEHFDRAAVAATIRLLHQQGALSVLSGGLLAWTEDGALRIVEDVASGTGSSPVSSPLPALLWTVFRQPVASPDGTPAGGERFVDESRLSSSFVRELREVVTPGRPFAALIVDHICPRDVVGEMRRISGSRVIYGAIPGTSGPIAAAG